MKQISNSPLDAAACSRSLDTPETDEMASMRRTHQEWQTHGEKLERERNALRCELVTLRVAAQGAVNVPALAQSGGEETSTKEKTNE